MAEQFGPYCENKKTGARSKQTLEMRNQQGQRDEMIQGVFWPEQVYKREKGQDLGFSESNEFDLFFVAVGSLFCVCAC